MVRTEGVKKYTSPKPGKTVAVIAGVHGDETCGVRLFDKILSDFNPRSGTVYFIYGNPKAIEKGVRYTEMNLNRAFRPEKTLTEKEKQSYERKRALELMPILEKCYASLDIHSSASKESIPFVICEPKSFFIAERLPVLIKSSGWDAIHQGSTDYFVNKSGGFGLCVECGSHNDPRAQELARKCLDNFLIIMGVISGETPSKQTDQRTIIVHKQYITKNNFIPARDFADFEKLREGELIGIDGSVEIRAKKDNVIIFCRRRKNPNEEAFILAKV